MTAPPPPLLDASYSKTKTGREQKDANELLDLRGFPLLPLGLEAQGHPQVYLELFTQGSSTSNTWGSRYHEGSGAEGLRWGLECF